LSAVRAIQVLEECAVAAEGAAAGVEGACVARRVGRAIIFQEAYG